MHQTFACAWTIAFCASCVFPKTFLRISLDLPKLTFNGRPGVLGLPFSPVNIVVPVFIYSLSLWA
ncbi:hypothetical protein J2128_001250 [Methanomicrobium sp. W14]|nr:hypothetical protein [Methanomicrobium sp. W14]